MCPNQTGMPLDIIKTEAGVTSAGTADAGFADESEAELDAILETAPRGGDKDFPNLDVEVSTYRQRGERCGAGNRRIAHGRQHIGRRSDLG